MGLEIRDTNHIIEKLVDAYREELEDDGDLIASELEKLVGNVVKCEYDAERDVLLLLPTAAISDIHGCAKKLKEVRQDIFRMVQ